MAKKSGGGSLDHRLPFFVFGSEYEGWTIFRRYAARRWAPSSQAADLAALEVARVAALGKKGSVTGLMKTLGGLAPEERREFGARVNQLKGEIEAALEARKGALSASALSARLVNEKIDVSLPARPEGQGSLHPIGQVMDELAAIFGEMGFTWADGPDIEDDWHNFTALNIPPDHPARQMQDTFYLPPRPDGTPMVLRTHTSPVQARTMLDKNVQKMLAAGGSLRIIVPGRTYRIDNDATHTPMFHQVEGLVIDRTTHMGHLKGCLVDFCRAFFEVDDLPLRFRPSYFPFTEPSAEVDIGCSWKDGELRIGAGDSWLEILGSGMVHPNVIANCGLDPAIYQGFAFGMGIDRIAMLKYGIPDLRSFFDVGPALAAPLRLLRAGMAVPHRRAGAMKFTLSWLKEHLDTKATLGELRDGLTMLGLEVEGITNPGETLKGFVVGYVVEAVQHPNADRLQAVPGRYRQRPGAGRVRRAQRAHRHEGHLRADRQLHPRHGHDLEGEQDPRRGEQRHAVLLPRAAAGRRP